MGNLERDKPVGVITRVEEVEELAEEMGVVAALGEVPVVRATLDMLSLPLKGGS